MAKLGSFGEVAPRGGRAVFTAYNKKIADDIGRKLAEPPRSFHPSPYQQAIFDWVTTNPAHVGHNAVVEAVAGAGKTTTMVQVCRLLNMQVNSATFHSIGLRAWQTVARPQVKGEKIEDLMEDLNIERNLRAVVGKLVSLAKQRGIGIPGLEDRKGDEPWLEIIEHFDLEEMIPGFVELHYVIDTAQAVLQESIAIAHEVIDFEDMIYMPLQSGVAIPQYDWVIVDELQDTNPTRRELAKRMLAPAGRFIGVGDPHQAIYGFTGADNDAMEIVAEELDCVRLPLTVTYRCPKSVVAYAQRWVSHIQAHETAPEGNVRTIKLKEFNIWLDNTQRFGVNRTGFTLKDVQQWNYEGGSITVEDAILCRNTRPLIETAFDMIRRRIPCHVEGRDIGQGLISLVKKWKSVRTVAQLRSQLEDHLEAETKKFLKRGRRDKVASLEDKVGTLMVFMASLHDDDSIFKLIESINSLFKDTETGKRAATVTLSTGHKSKGREWKRVFILGMNVFQPSPYAKQDWQIQQEENLCYVEVTRAMEELIMIDYPRPGEEEEEPIYPASGMYIGEGNDHIEDSIRDRDNWPTMQDFQNVANLPGAPQELRDDLDLRHMPAVEGAKVLGTDIRKKSAVDELDKFLRSFGVAPPPKHSGARIESLFDSAPRRYLTATELQQKVDSGELKELHPHSLDYDPLMDDMRANGYNEEVD